MSLTAEPVVEAALAPKLQELMEAPIWRSWPSKPEAWTAISLALYLCQLAYSLYINGLGLVPLVHRLCIKVRALTVAAHSVNLPFLCGVASLYASTCESAIVGNDLISNDACHKCVAAVSQMVLSVFRSYIAVSTNTCNPAFQCCFALLPCTSASHWCLALLLRARSLSTLCPCICFPSVLPVLNILAPMWSLPLSRPACASGPRPHLWQQPAQDGLQHYSGAQVQGPLLRPRVCEQGAAAQEQRGADPALEHAAPHCGAPQHRRLPPAVHLVSEAP